jgi:hypothetical protein
VVVVATTSREVARAALVALALLVVARPAWAQPSMDHNSAPASSDVTVTVAASVDELNAYNEKLTVEAPTGFRMLTCGRVDGFTCTTSRSGVTWQRSAPGQPVPLATDNFPFRMHTIDKPGKYTFVLTQLYSDGKSERATPVLQVTAAPPSPSTTATTAARATLRPAGVTTSPTAIAARRAPSHAPVTEPAWFGDNSGEAGPQMAIHEAGHDERRASTSMLIVGAGFALAAGGVFWFRRRVARVS